MCFFTKMKFENTADFVKYHPFMFVFQSNRSTPKRDLSKDHTVRLKYDLEQVQQETRELQERLMVSEATVQAQAEQLKDYRELLSE